MDRDSWSGGCGFLTQVGAGLFSQHVRRRPNRLSAADSLKVMKGISGNFLSMTLTSASQRRSLGEKVTASGTQGVDLR